MVTGLLRWREVADEGFPVELSPLSLGGRTPDVLGNPALVEDEPRPLSFGFHLQRDDRVDAFRPLRPPPGLDDSLRGREVEIEPRDVTPSRRELRTHLPVHSRRRARELRVGPAIEIRVVDLLRARGNVDFIVDRLAHRLSLLGAFAQIAHSERNT